MQLTRISTACFINCFREFFHCIINDLKTAEPLRNGACKKKLLDRTRASLTVFYVLMSWLESLFQDNIYS